MSQSDNRLHLRYGVPAMFVPNSVGEGFPLPFVENLILLTGGAPLSLPCVRGGAARSTAEGVFLTETIFFFFPANFTPLQSLRRSRAGSLCRGVPFWACANIAS